MPSYRSGDHPPRLGGAPSWAARGKGTRPASIRSAGKQLPVASVGSGARLMHGLQGLTDLHKNRLLTDAMHEALNELVAYNEQDLRDNAEKDSLASTTATAIQNRRRYLAAEFGPERVAEFGRTLALMRETARKLDPRARGKGVGLCA